MDANKRQPVYDLLEKLRVPYEVQEHPAVYTIEETMAYRIPLRGTICKNLFLRDTSGKRHFLVTMNGNKRADLRAISDTIDSSRLSFASPERMQKYLRLQRGEVTLFGLVNDHTRAVEVIVDRDLADAGPVGIHPNDNTATVWLQFDDLMKVLEHLGYEVTFIEMK